MFGKLLIVIVSSNSLFTKSDFQSGSRSKGKANDSVSGKTFQISSFGREAQSVKAVQGVASLAHDSIFLNYHKSVVNI